jgi:hypothetical protein
MKANPNPNWLDEPTTANTEPSATTNIEPSTTAATEQATVANTEQAAELDSFDLAALRLDQSFTQGGGAKKLLTTVPVRKPNKQDFFRVHRDRTFRETLAIIELKENREVYLLLPEVARSLPNEFVMAMMYTTINRQGVVHLWPVNLPGPDGKVLEWHRSAATAAERAMEHWVRVTANMSLGAYEIFKASAAIPEPTWPDLSFKELLRIAFKDRLVTDLNHPLVKRLRGET